MYKISSPALKIQSSPAATSIEFVWLFFISTDV